VRGYFLESFDPRNGDYAGVVVKREPISLGLVDFPSVVESDYEHYGFSSLIGSGVKRVEYL
jgi:hypothetical protein